MKNNVRVLVASVLMIFVLTACAGKQVSLTEAPKKPKNVIMIIGDGMGPEQVGFLLTYARQASNGTIKNQITGFDRILAEGGSLGLSLTNSHGTLAVDSAASGSQMATGVFSGSEMIGLDHNGNPVQTVVERAALSGKSTGLISDTRVTHATPAAFAAHQPHRDMENEIAVDMLNNGVDVLMGGGLRNWIPQEANEAESAVKKELESLVQGAVKIKSKRKDSRNLLTEASAKGYHLAFNKTQMEASQGKLLGLFTNSAMPDAIQVSNSLNDPARAIPTLKEMSAKALDILSKNEKGFFLMIEAGLIDWAAHYNDAGLMLHELIRLNETVDYCLDWAKDRGDTLIIVTADHTTGGFGFSYNAKNMPEAKALPGKMFADKKYQPEYNFGDPQVLDRLYSQKLSYTGIFGEFDGMAKESQTPEALARLVNQYTQFPITPAQAARVLETEENPIFQEGHSYLGSKQVPKLDNKDEFFVYQTDDNRQNLLALEVAADQNAVWNTGTHTSTPVLVFTKGPAGHSYGQILHHTQVGQITMDAVTTP